MKSEIDEVIKNSELSTSTAKNMEMAFNPLFAKAKELAQGYEEIVVTDETQKDLIKQAREKRLAIRKIRIDVDKLRKQMKAESLRTGKAIDGMANIIKFLIVPIEEHLQAQEDFPVLKEKERLELLLSDRMEKLSKYNFDATGYQIELMPDGVFDQLLESTKNNYEAKEKERIRLEEEDKRQQEINRLYNERKLSLAPYTDFLEGFTLTVTTTEKEFEESLKSSIDRKKAHDDEVEKMREKNKELEEKASEEKKAHEAELEKQRLEKEKLEKEIEDKKQAEILEKQKEDQRLKDLELEKLKAEKEARLAPDKDKLRVAYKAINEVRKTILDIKFENPETQKIIDGLLDNLYDQLQTITKKVKEL